MTPEQKQAYIKNPYKCPFCGSEHVNADPAYMEHVGSGVAIMEVDCSDCSCSWTEEWTLTKIHEEGE